MTTSKIYYTWWANLSTNLPIILSIIGFVFAVVVLYPSCNKNSTYHDVVVSNKRPIADSFYSYKIHNLQTNEDHYSTIPISKSSSDTVKRNDTITKIRNVIFAARYEALNLNNNNVDTNLKYFSKTFSVDRQAFRSAIDSLKHHNSYSVKVALIDTSYFSRSLDKSVFLTLEKRNITLISFFDKYSTFGFWFFFSIAQMSLWFLLSTLVIGTVRDTRLIVPNLSYNFKNAIFFSILPTISILIFIVLLYKIIIGANIIEDFYFLNDYNTRIMFYSFPGYSVAALCFGSYLFLSNKLELLNVGAKNTTMLLANNTPLQTEYDQLKKAFNLTFSFTAIILSVFIIWVGLLFNSVNDVEAMKFYSFFSGKPFLNYDFVYLIGLIHTLLLLIFYIPVRLRFNSLEITQQNTANVNAGLSPTKKFLSAFWDSLGTIIITTSPLITTLLQKLISNIIQ